MKLGFTRIFLSLSLVFVLALTSQIKAQKPNPYSSNQIYSELLKFGTLANVLYVAAHPDDENTRMISYFSNVLHANTAYFSFTRGDGGQNLLGTEIGDLLGVLRTQELLQARSIDGGTQFFSRAIDFGYSKHPDETLSIWDKEKARYDIIKVIRSFKPDIIINRFDHRTPGKTHGHHTSSAMLSHEVFEDANDPSVYPDQLKNSETWQASRLFFNTSWWFYGSREKFAEADKSNLISMDIGEYIPLLGKSNAEIASEARSMHKCQGFGSAGSRSSRQEYLEVIKGSNPNPSQSPFAGIDITWTRVENGAAVKEALDNITNNFNFSDPSQHLPELLELKKKVASTGDAFWSEKKLADLQEIIANCAGLYLDAFTDIHKASLGDSVELKIEATNRSNSDIKLTGYTILKTGAKKTEDRELVYAEENIFYHNFLVDKSFDSSTPYWLKNTHELGTYTLDSDALIGKPKNDPVLEIQFDVEIDGTPFSLVRPVTYKYVEPSFGEITKPFEVVPEVSVIADQEVYIFASEEAKNITVEISAGTGDVDGQLSLEVPSGWKVSPSSHDFSFKHKGEKKSYEFSLTPPKDRSVDKIVPVATVNGNRYSKSTFTISYDHIPEQTVSLDAASLVSRIPIVRRGKEKVGYVMGAGDKIPDALENMGYEVVLIDPAETLPMLSDFQAILIGIRAYNTVEELPLIQSALFEYAKSGGNLITQYNTTWRLKSSDVAPFDLQLSRDRVCQEDAEVKVLKPNHPSMFYPNQLGEEDWDGWVQERGLYFPDEWGSEFEAILSMHDSGESAKEGSLLVAPYGEGYFVYTGLSFFRELPAGVPGAYRLMANLISLGTNKR